MQHFFNAFVCCVRENLVQKQSGEVMSGGRFGMITTNYLLPVADEVKYPVPADESQRNIFEPTAENPRGV